jgi:DNA-binding transcriptional LysR family regulator
MDLNLVRTFSRVVEAESFTAAARSLGVRKSSVSRAVSRLEEQLGARLLERTTRQVKLTVTGRVYYDSAIRALAALTDAEQFVAESQGEPRGIVRLSVPLAADRGCLSEIVARFTESYPAIRVEVSFTDRVVDLVGEGFDLALRGSRNGRLQGQSLIARKVAQMSLWLLAAPSYLKSRRLPRRPADLRNLDFILYARGGNTFKTLELMGPRGLEPVEVTGVLSSDDALFIRELVLRGAGVTLMVPRMEDLRSGALVRVLPDYEVPDLTISVVMPSNRHLPRRVALFRDALIEGFKRVPGALNESLASAPRQIASGE